MDTVERARRRENRRRKAFTDSWRTDAVRPGWVRVRPETATYMRKLGAEVEAACVDDVGSFPIVRVWAMDLFGQASKFLPRDPDGFFRGVTPDDREACDAILRALYERLRGFGEAEARAAMAAAFAAMSLGGQDAALGVARCAGAG